MDFDKELRFREVTEGDQELLLEWANEKETRRQSFQMHRITIEEHNQWFQRVIRDSNIRILILCFGETPAGNIRFSIDGGCAELSYSVDCRYRGQGFGKELIKMAVAYADEHLKVSSLQAKTKRDNLASQRILISNGFQLVEHLSGQEELTFLKSLHNPVCL